MLDISCKVEPEFLAKYNLKANSAILGDDSHIQMYLSKKFCSSKLMIDFSYEDIKKMHASEIEYIPGGSGQNALRTASVNKQIFFLFYLNSKF